MKSLVGFLSLLLTALGFVVPILLIPAALFALLYIGMSPAGKRIDGRSRTGGLLGGVWDDFVAPTKQCKACKQEIAKDATRCHMCTEVQDSEPAYMTPCVECNADIPEQTIRCPHCNELQRTKEQRARRRAARVE